MIAFIVSFLCTIIAMPFLLDYCKKNHYYDSPNSHRKLHKGNIPRLGGVLFFPAAAMGLLAALVFIPEAWMDEEMMKIYRSSGNLLNERLPLHLSTLLLIPGAFVIYLVGIIDDFLDVSAKHKFIIQIIVALAMPFSNLYINNFGGLFGLNEIPLYIAYPITVLGILLIVNAINLIDGIDGLASGLSIISLIGFAYIFNQRNLPIFANLSYALIGTVFAFFLFNYFGTEQRGTKIFMGDGGSLFLGYCLAYFALKEAMNNPVVAVYDENALMYSLILLFLPIADLTRVACERKLNHKPMFKADKTHLHHRLMDTGLSMHGALGVILLLQIVICALGWICLNVLHFGATITLIFIIVVFILFNICVYSLRKKEEEQG